MNRQNYYECVKNIDDEKFKIVLWQKVLNQLGQTFIVENVITLGGQEIVCTVDL